MKGGKLRGGKKFASKHGMEPIKLTKKELLREKLDYMRDDMVECRADIRDVWQHRRELIAELRSEEKWLCCYYRQLERITARIIKIKKQLKSCKK